MAHPISTSSHCAACLALLAALATMLPLAGCTDHAGNEPSREQVNAAVDKTEAATRAAARKAAELAETVRDKTVAFAKSPQVRQDAANAKQALEHAVDKAREPVPPSPPDRP